MPYIEKEYRLDYDVFIDKLFEELKGLKNDELLGHMNYIIFRLAGLLCNHNGRRSYARMATVSSAMSEAQAEFRRRVMAPYEDERIESNGDVEL